MKPSIAATHGGCSIKSTVKCIPDCVFYEGRDGEKTINTT